MREEIAALNADRKYLVSEIFGPTIQGEGPLIGRQTMFIRFAGCDFRCSWCDSMHAVDPEKHHDEWRKMTAREIVDELHAIAGQPMLVTLSGGNPAMWELDAVFNAGRPLGYSFACETQGTIAKSWFSRLWWLVISPKGPSSGMPFNEEALRQCVLAGPSKLSFKFVIDDMGDLAFARRVSNLWPRVPVYLQPANRWFDDDAEETDPLGVYNLARLDKLRWLVSVVMGIGWTRAIVLPQLHVLLWGNRRAV